MTKLDATEWNPREDCLIPATGFCDNCQLVSNIQTGVARYKCLGHFRGGNLRVPEDPPPIAPGQVASSASSSTRNLPVFVDLLRGIKPKSVSTSGSWVLRLGVTKGLDGAELGSSPQNSSSSNLLGGLLKTREKVIGPHQFNSLIVYRQLYTAIIGTYPNWNQ